MSTSSREEDHQGTFAPTRWRRIQAINGRGQILIGPNELSAKAGAIVIAPPGVLVRGPVGQEPLSRSGWRQARWSLDREGCVLIDQARPDELVEVSLEQVVQDVASWAPDQLGWVAAVVERQLRILVGRMARDCRGRMHPKAVTAFDELTDAKREADAAFACLRQMSCKAPESLSDDYFAGIVRVYVDELEADRSRFKAAVKATGERARESPGSLRTLWDLGAPASSEPWDAV
jgi:hypothetical protein